MKKKLIFILILLFVIIIIGVLIKVLFTCIGCNNSNKYNVEVIDDKVKSILESKLSCIEENERQEKDVAEDTTAYFRCYIKDKRFAIYSGPDLTYKIRPEQDFGIAFIYKNRLEEEKDFSYEVYPIANRCTNSNQEVNSWIIEGKNGNSKIKVNESSYVLLKIKIPKEIGLCTIKYGIIVKVGKEVYTIGVFNVQVTKPNFF